MPTGFPRFLAASKCSRKMSDIFRYFSVIFPSFSRHFSVIFLIFFTPVLEKALLGRLRTGPRYPRGRGASDVERRAKSGRPLESYYLWQPHNLSDSFLHVSDIFPSFSRHFSVIFPTFSRHFRLLKICSDGAENFCTPKTIRHLAGNRGRHPESPGGRLWPLATI